MDNNLLLAFLLVSCLELISYSNLGDMMNLKKKGYQDH